ncbi:hypothetical protein Srot_2043 [Segniliparus rotundus DSM 44985]|uniref:Uncharacterized protein n=1 Tax=Segniliparus rotundus (strain ATCC BAA-972 / CDC 1076 / CIP 108378 / DSM 44985 / JCM 13578) TaxID=640132 RepID=D6Z969_SEGRD|nr:hypothetical protein [Segniliparus rotundus]ADG98499.1 hypothetical protein Srot_2043 [Segniliparus rotundus DSM 44985]
MTEPKDNDTTAETPRPKRPAAKPASGKSAKVKPSSRGASLRSRLALGAGERKTKRPGGSSAAKTALIALSLIGNVIALSVIGWFLYAKSLPGSNGSVVGLKLSEPGVKLRTKEEETARQYVNNMMNFDFHHLDSFNAAMSAGISGDLKKTTGPDQLNAIKQLFTTLEASSQFQIVSSDVIEDKPDEAVVVVAGHQTLNLKGDKGPRSMSTIIKVTVQKKDQSVSGLESLDDLRKSPQDQAPPLFPGGGPQDGQAKPAPKPGQTSQPQGQ